MTLVDLAVRGFVKIEEVDDKGIVFHHKDYIFHLLKPGDQWSGLAPHEQVMLKNVFASGDDTRLVQLEEPLLYGDPSNKARHQVRTEDQGHVSARS